MEEINENRELKYNLIGIAGKAESGKDTFAEYLKAHYLKMIYEPDRNRIESKLTSSILIKHFADPLKEAAIAAFGFIKDEVYTTEGKKTINEFWKNTPRYFLQKLGTECFREIFGDNFWLRRAELEIEKDFLDYSPPFGIIHIFADIRFENECDWVRDKGGLLIHIDRGNREGGTLVDNHASEQALEFKDGDILIENRGTLEDLESAADLMIMSIITQSVSKEEEQREDQKDA